MTDLGILLQKSEMLSFWLWHSTVEQNPNVFPSFPLPGTVGHSVEPEKSQPEAVHLQNCTFLAYCCLQGRTESDMTEAT